MAVAYQISSSLRNAMADLIGTAVDAGSGAGKLEIYTGTLDAALDPTGDTLLATLTLNDPSTSGAASGVETFNVSGVTVTVAASGTAGWFRIVDSANNPVIGGNIATSSAALVTSTVSWLAGGTATLTAGSVTVPAN